MLEHCPSFAEKAKLKPGCVAVPMSPPRLLIFRNALPTMRLTMNFPDCQYSHVTWIRTDSPNFTALSAALKTKTPQAAIKNFLETLISAHKEFQQGVGPGVNILDLLKVYQDKTGIISRRDFTLPDVPPDPNNPDSPFVADLIEGFAGSLCDEAGEGILAYTLIMDLIRLLDVKAHIKGVLLNNRQTDLTEIEIRVDGMGIPSLLPMSRTIPGIKKIMNPVDKKNYECAGFVLFGAVGIEAWEGFAITLRAEIPRLGLRPMYFEYYTAGGRGVSWGTYERHGELRDTWFEPGEHESAAWVEGGMLDSVCVFSTQPD
jgi:hypothetical protein